MPAPESACVGHFISAEQLHLVAVDDHSLVFEQLAPETNSSGVRLPLAVEGRIVALYRVPAPQPTAAGAPDVLLIHTQVTIPENEADADESEDEPEQRNKLHFKRYDAETQQLQTVSSVTYYDMDFSDAPTKRTVAVNLGPGPMAGTVVFVKGERGSLYFVDPYDPSRGVSYVCDAKPYFRPHAQRVYWLSEDIVAVAGVEQLEVLKFLRVERRAKSADEGFKITSMGSVLLASHFEVPGIGSVHDATHGTLGVVFRTDETLRLPAIRFYAFHENKAELVHELELDVPEKDPQVVGNCPPPVCYSQRVWRMLPSSSSDSLFVSDDALVLRLRGVQCVSISRVEGLPEHVGLVPVGLGICRMYSGMVQAIQLVRLRENKCEQVLRPQLYELETAQLVTHKRDDFFGGSYWFSCESIRPDGIVTAQLFKTELTLGSSLLPIKGYPFVAPITGVWWLHERLLVSTTDGTGLYEMNGSKLERVASEFDGEGVTIAAAPGVQVFSDAVSFAGSPRLSLPLSVMCAAIDGEHVVVASADTVLMVQHGRIIREMTFDEVIVGVDWRDSVLAVCTANTLHVLVGPAYEQDSEQDSEPRAYALREAATCVACGPNRHVYVGDVEGDVYVWPEQQYVSVADNPVKCMRAQPRGVIVLAGPSGSVFIHSDGRFTRLRIADVSDVLLNETQPLFGVALLEGVLHFLNVDSDAVMVPLRLDCTELMHGRLESVKFYGRFAYSFGFTDEDEWTLQRAPLENTRQIESFKLPFDDFPNYEVRMLSETKFLEVAKKERQVQGSGGRNTRFETDTIVRLCELGPGQVRVLDETRVHVMDGMLEDDFDEPLEWIKSFSKHEFIIFASSESAVVVSVEPSLDPRTVQIGRDATIYRRLSSSYWMPEDSGRFLFVDPLSGDVVNGTAREFREPEPIQDRGPNFPGKVIGKVTRSWRDTVKSAVTARGPVAAATVGAVGHAESENPYLVTAVKSGETSFYSQISLAEAQPDRLRPVASLRAHNRSPSLVRVCGNSEFRSRSKYAAALHPVAAVGTGRGGIYVLLHICDKQLERALLDVQALLRETVEVADDTAAADDANTIDGVLLMAALRKPEAESAFAAAGLNAAELKRALQDSVV